MLSVPAGPIRRKRIETYPLKLVSNGMWWGPRAGVATKYTNLLMWRSLACPVWLLLASIATCGVAAAATPEELGLFQMTNSARVAQGLPPLQWDDALADAARAHVVLVLQNGKLSHRYANEEDLSVRVAEAGGHFGIVAENIAMGASVSEMQNEWMRSPPHRANILDPKLNAVGFAVVRHGGSLYAVADFDRSVPSLSAEQVEESIAKLLVRKVHVDGPSVDARQTCEMTHGSAGGSSPLFVMRWQSSDLSHLPSALTQQLDTGRYRSAAVGACSSANAESGFTSYRVAVLLY
jgi:hypothetical protein